MSSFLPTSKEQWAGLALILTIATTIWLIAFQRMETQGLYHPDSTNYPNPTAALTYSPLKSSIQDVYFKAQDGTLLNAWYVPPKPNYPTLVFAHGNGGNIGNRLYVIDLFTRAGYGFLAFDYRGYGNSKGALSEKGLYQDLEAASRYLSNVQQTSLSKQIALGESLGSGVAVDVAAHLPFRAVVIFSTLTSAPDVAEHLISNSPWRILPIQLLMQQRFDSLSKIQKVRSPLIIMHGLQDQMMPVQMPKALFTKATTKYKKLLLIPGAEHNDVLDLGADRLLNTLHQLLMETKTQ